MSQPAPAPVVVAGATGFVGTHVVRHLLAAGMRPICLVRRGGRGLPPDLRGRCVETPVDYQYPGSLRAAIPPRSVLIHAIGTTRDTADISLWETNYGITRALLAGATDPAGIVFFSGIGTAKAASDPYFQSKWRSEELIRRTGAGHVILRLSYIIGQGDEIVTPLMKSGEFEVIGDGKYRLQPILIDDVCAAVVSAVSMVSRVRLTMDMPGPETVSLLELVELAANVSGHMPALSYVSVENALRRALKGGLPGTEEIVVMLCDDLSASTEAYRTLGIQPTPLRRALEICRERILKGA